MTLLRNLLVAAALLGLPAVVLAFQFADGAPPAPAPPEKFIFYWGKHQCDLTTANGYQGTLALSTGEFRQVLLSPPSVWDGHTLQRNLSFQLDGKALNTADYLSQVSWLDTLVGQKAQPGQILRITGLALDQNQTATILIQIKAEQKNTQQPDPPRWPWVQPSFHNTKFLDQVVWGREDIYELSNRDFFSETEFWQTVRQMPYLLWREGVAPRAVTASIRFSDAGSFTFDLSAALEETDYRQMLDKLEHYRHLVQPNATIALALKTTQQHEELYQKPMILVPDNDPRLALRRNRDTHALVIRWGGWEEKLENLYLRQFTDPAGTPFPADGLVYRRRTTSGLSSDIRLRLTLPLEAWLDGEPLSDISCHIKIGEHNFLLHAGETLPDTLADTLATQMTETLDRREIERLSIQLDSFLLPGFDLPPIVIGQDFVNLSNALLVRNDFKTLSGVAGYSLATLEPPHISGNEVVVDFNLPRPMILQLSIFEPEGHNTYTLKDKYAAGRQSLRVPRSVFRKPGKYICFLNTPIGVSKQEFYVD